MHAAVHYRHCTGQSCKPGGSIQQQSSLHAINNTGTRTGGDHHRFYQYHGHKQHHCYQNSGHTTNKNGTTTDHANCMTVNRSVNTQSAPLPTTVHNTIPVVAGLQGTCAVQWNHLAALRERQLCWGCQLQVLPVGRPSWLPFAAAELRPGHSSSFLLLPAWPCIHAPLQISVLCCHLSERYISAVATGGRSSAGTETVSAFSLSAVVSGLHCVFKSCCCLWGWLSGACRLCMHHCCSQTKPTALFLCPAAAVVKSLYPTIMIQHMGWGQQLTDTLGLVESQHCIGRPRFSSRL